MVAAVNRTAFADCACLRPNPGKLQPRLRRLEQALERRQSLLSEHGESDSGDSMDLDRSLDDWCCGEKGADRGCYLYGSWRNC